MAKSKTKKMTLNANNPFHMMIVLITSVFQLLMIILTWIYKVLILMFKHWLATLIILAVIFVLMYTFGVL